MTESYKTFNILLENVEHSLLLSTSGLISGEILEPCLVLAEKGIAIELYIEQGNEEYLTKNPFILNKCCLLINNGASISIVPKQMNKYSWQCITDFKEYSHNTENIELIDFPIESIEFQDSILFFEKLKNEALPYLVEKGDIQIIFKTSDTLLLNGDFVEIYWEVENATTVIIQGLGEVNAYGSKRIKLEKDTILKIGASNGRQSKIKAVFIKILDKNIKIPYDIKFKNGENDQYISLINSELYPHVYGVSKGNMVKLSWNIPDAESIKILPFNCSNRYGDFIFSPDSTISIEIHITLKQKLFIRKIQLLVFPIPIFKEKIASLKFLNANIFSIPIPNRNNDKINAILAFEKKRNSELNKKISDKYLSIESKKINLKNTNNSFFSNLKEKYFTKKEIVNELKSIHAFYEQPTARSRAKKSSI